ncbi:MAG: RNA methyltransferase [Desulfobulbus sp.]|nr:MAG: RNA methyltransferase [Desulfobulbus sp.]RUM35865.1 MAG: RNA methyltransferase [Desulfobulbus sp.]RUM41025.1 MAG: RNA methyltransferase [Desulfobulbus sp.]
MQTDLHLDVALIHYPVVNRNDEIIGSAVTNLDLHDIARAARTYGIGTYWVVTPDRQQQELASEIVGHWTKGYGGTVNVDRASALSIIKICSDIAEVISAIEIKYGDRPLVVATSAITREKTITHERLKKRLDKGRGVVILFGTAWGLAPEIIELVDVFLPPLGGPGKYNHLSVRSAASIVLDRLLGKRT